MTAAAGYGHPCACRHSEDQHQWSQAYGGRHGGVCTVELPPFEEEELPAWRCPCRLYRAAGTPARVLRTVQSCTVQAADQREQLSDRAAAAILDLVDLDRELRGA